MSLLEESYQKWYNTNIIMNTSRIINNTLEETYIDIKDNNFPSTNGIFAHVQEQDVPLHYDMKGYHLLSSMRTTLTWWNQTCAAEIFKIKFLGGTIALSPQLHFLHRKNILIRHLAEKRTSHCSLKIEEIYLLFFSYEYERVCSFPLC